MLDVIINSNNSPCDWLSVSADVCILAITIYTTWKTFWQKRIKCIYYKPSIRMFGGDMLSITVENLSLSPVSLLSVNIIYDNKYKLNLVKYDTPFILMPMQATNISSEPFSQLSQLSISELSLMNYHIEFITTNGTVYEYFKRKDYKPNLKTNEHTIITKIRNTFNGIVRPYDSKYALLLHKFNYDKTIIINDGGLMSDDVFGINAIPREIINDENAVLDYIKNIIDKCDSEIAYKLVSF